MYHDMRTVLMFFFMLNLHKAHEPLIVEAYRVRGTFWGDVFF